MIRICSLKAKAVIFDLDGVVINSERIYDVADRDFLLSRGVIYDREKIVSDVMGKSLFESTSILKDFYSLDGTVEELFLERKNLLAEMYEDLVDFIQGFEEFHATLARRRIPTFIATASERTLLKIADERLRLSEIFLEKIFTIADVGNKSKPDPAIFTYAASQMNIQPDQCVVIEDSPNGVLAAKNANMLCIAITTTQERMKLSLADLIVSGFHELCMD